jgi:ESCRT-II complex subunit VPS22
MKGLQQKREQQRRKEEEGGRLRVEKIAAVRATLDQFRVALEDFAGKHKARINADPEFRDQFHRLCKAVKVDPLASSKGFWTDILGLGDFYFELGVIIVEKCLQTRGSNGGMILLSDLLQLVRAHSTGRHSTSEEDVLQALDKLKVLGSGFRLLAIGQQRFVLSVPMEINKDGQELIAEAQEHGFVAEDSFLSPLHSSRQPLWSRERFQFVMAPLLREGLVLIDRTPKGRIHYYFPSVSL